MKIGLLGGACEGHTQCHIVDPDLFPIDDDGFSTVGDELDVPDGEETLAELGVAACPVRALKVMT